MKAKPRRQGGWKHKEQEQGVANRQRTYDTMRRRRRIRMATTHKQTGGWASQAVRRLSFEPAQFRGEKLQRHLSGGSHTHVSSLWVPNLAGSASCGQDHRQSPEGEDDSRLHGHYHQCRAARILELITHISRVSGVDEPQVPCRFDHERAQ